MFLRTLGGLALEGTTLKRPKPLLLLSYLALEGAKSRRHLADLFFLDTTNPLNSLSKSMSNIRKIAPEALHTHDQRVATTLPCDVVGLMDLLEAQRLAEAVATYEEPFLEAFTLAGLSAELENWIYGTREYIGKLVREALLRLAEQEAALGRTDAAARFAARAYTLPGAAELEPEDFPRLYHLLREGRSFQAADLRREAHDLGIELGHASFILNQTGSKSLPSHNLPKIKTSFIGRARELEAISKQLSRADCKLLTLHGSGGVGKSRLAFQVVHTLLQKQVFSSAIQLDLATLTSAQHIPAGLAEALDFTLQGQLDPLTQVAAQLGDKRCLILLDNFEQLMTGAFVPTALLAACPNLKILVTSRERLNLEEEWVYNVLGFPLPAPDTGLEKARSEDAIRLFVQRAKRSRLDFKLRPEALPALHSICRLVEGFPLGLELAAAWVRLLSCDEIASELAQSLKLLSTEARNVPERQRSIYAVLNQSWQRSSVEERRVLKTLAVFRGGFRKEAAQAVTGATLPLLASLVDKSLLRMMPTGRFDRHVMLYQYTLERLAESPAEQAAARAAHAAYFHNLLLRLEPNLHGEEPQTVMQTLEEELGNLQQAWLWWAEQREAAALQAVVIPLRIFFDRQGRFQEGLNFFDAALRALNQAEHPVALGMLLVEQAWLHFRLGDHHAAGQAARHGLGILRPLEARRGIIEGLHILGALKFYAGALVQARQDWAEALTLSEADDAAEAQARSLDYLGVVEEHLGNYEEAYRYHQASLILCRRSNNKARMVQVLNNSGALALLMARADEAESLLSEGLTLAQAIRAKRDIPYLFNNLARVSLMRANFSEASSLGQEALSLAQEIGESWLEAKVLVETLGPLALDLGNIKEAQATFTRCLGLTHRMEADHISLQALLGLASVHEAKGEVQQAAFLLGVIVNHSEASPITERTARAHLEALHNIPAAKLQDALNQAKTTELGTAIHRLLDLKGNASP